MKVKITLEPGQTLTDAEEILEKASKLKKECSDTERYHDEPLNEFHDYVCSRNKSILDNLMEEIEAELKTNAHK